MSLSHYRPWFAWRPVRLYETGEWTWLRKLYYRVEYESAPKPNDLDNIDIVGIRYSTTEDASFDILSGRGIVDKPVLPFENTITVLMAIPVIFWAICGYCLLSWLLS